MAATDPLSSPALSATSTSSYDFLSSHSLSSSGYLFQDTSSSSDSDDEIVYSVSEGSEPSHGSARSNPASDDDFVVLSRPRSPKVSVETGLSTPNEDDDRANTPVVARLAADLERLAVNDPSLSRAQRKKASGGRIAAVKPKKKPKGKVTQAAVIAAKSYPSPAPSPIQVQQVSKGASGPQQSKEASKLKAKKKAKKAKKKAKKVKKEAKKAAAAASAAKAASGLGARPIVDDISERLSEDGDADSAPGALSVYDEAVGYITSFLSNPAAREDSACRLTLLQALIIELGLAYSSLPASLTAAKAFLKSRAFLNIREYLAVRGQGPAAVRKIMHPSKSALVKELRKKKNAAPLGWVKDSGLQVLLVPCHYR